MKLNIINVIFMFLFQATLLFTNILAQNVMLPSVHFDNNNDSTRCKQNFGIEYKYKLFRYYNLIDVSSIEDEPSSLTEKVDTIYNEFDWIWIGYYKNSKRHGRWLKIDENMLLLNDVIYDKGKVIEFKTFNREGVILVTGKINKESNKMEIRNFTNKDKPTYYIIENFSEDSLQVPQ